LFLRPYWRHLVARCRTKTTPLALLELLDQGAEMYREAYLLAIGFRNCLWIRDLRGGPFANCANGPLGTGL